MRTILLVIGLIGTYIAFNHYKRGTKCAKRQVKTYEIQGSRCTGLLPQSEYQVGDDPW